MNQQTMHDVFIVYAADDMEWVDDVLLPMLKIPAERIFTKDKFTPGADKIAEYERAVRINRYTLLILSPAFFADVWARYGGAIASYFRVTSQKNLFLPLLLHPCELPQNLDQIVSFDCTETSRWNSEIERLRHLLTRSDVTPLVSERETIAELKELVDVIRKGSKRRDVQAIQIFLCHAQEDEIPALNFYEKLYSFGLKPWMSKKDILPGERWELRIKQAIQQSDIVLIFLSNKSVQKRGYLQKEIRFVLEKSQEMLDIDIYVIPIRLDDCDVPEALRDYQWIDWFKEPDLDRLVLAIKRGIARRQNEPS